MGIEFANPLGLAAGVDKNGRCARRWRGMGFGFAELGTVTGVGQPGNPKPRIFRFPDDGAILNRMGFNNEGLRSLAGRSSLFPELSYPLGINIGKSKVTPLELAAKEYGQLYGGLARNASYVVINVSSPNTPGLRDLQSVDFLREIVGEIRMAESSRHPPLLVKIAPDLHSDDLDAVVRVAHDEKLDGIIATNTTIDKSVLSVRTEEAGGVSGRPLRKRSNEVLSHLAQNCDERMTLIGVGGVFSGEDIAEKLRLGAHLVQVYTGWVYGGPRMPARALTELLEIMDREGMSSVTEFRTRGA